MQLRFIEHTVYPWSRKHLVNSCVYRFYCWIFSTLCGTAEVLLKDNATHGRMSTNQDQVFNKALV